MNGKYGRSALWAVVAVTSLVTAACSSNSPASTATSAPPPVTSAAPTGSSAGGGTTTGESAIGSSGGSGSASQPATSQAPVQTANVNAAGSPTNGGTLRVIGNADVDHLDTASGYYTTTYTLERAFSRQLYANPASTDSATSISVAPDIATELPTAANGGVSADGKTYTFHLRPGVKWDTQPARAVTAADFILGFKRLCNPTQNSVGAPGYYIGVIKGMDTYCAGFKNVKPTIADFKAYMTGHEISGMKAINDTTLQVQLVNPAADFVNILTLPFSSAVPVEYLNYLPDDANFRQHTISDGPYSITHYVPGQSYTLDKNPAWTQESDPIRHQYVDHIQVTMGPDENGVQQQIAAGTQDMSWDTTVPTSSVPQLKATNDARMGIYPNYDTNPFLVINQQSSNNGGALGKVEVRQAIEYAINKVSKGKIYGGPSLNTPLNQIIPPGNVGYEPFDPYPTPNNSGDPAKCKSMLAAAGYPNGFTLIDVYRTSGKHPDVYQSVQADLQACGITVKGVPSKASDYYGKYLSDPTGSKKGTWDISEPGWIPDWYGNNARSVMEPLLDGRHYGPGSTDWSGYNNPIVNADIDKALTSTDPAVVQKAMHEADVQAMKDAVIVPFHTQSTPLMRSERVHNAIELPSSVNFDVTQIWLNPAS